MIRCFLVLTLLTTACCSAAIGEDSEHFRRWANKEEARKFRLISDNVPSLEVLIPRPDFADSEAILPKNPKNYTLDQRVQEIIPKLNRKFFSGVFRKNYAKAYEIALEEEHNVLPMQLVSDEMRSQASPSLWGGSVELWEELLALDDRFRRMDALDQQKILFAWREPFREQLQSYVSYRSSLKPWWSASLISNTASDSNVNRTPDGVNAPANLSGRSGGQQTMVLNINIKPLVNNKKFSKDYKWDNVLNVVKQNQFAHQENDLATLSYEPKLTKNLDGPFSMVSLAYRYQQLLLNPNSFNSREVKSFNQSHRLKLDLGSKSYPLDWGIIRQGKGELSLSQEWKAPFDPGVTSQEGAETKIKLSHSMKMAKGVYRGGLSAYLELADFETDSSPASDYDYWKINFQNSHKYKWSFWKYPVEFREKLEMRVKAWDQRAGGKFDEDLYTVAFKVGTRVQAKLKSSLEVKQNWRETSQATTPVTETSAKQTQVTFNLTWKIK